MRMRDLSILVVSSDANFRDYLCNYLLMDGHYVDVTDKSNIAKQMLQVMHYDLILLNLSDYNHEADILSEEDIHKINPHSEVVFLLNPNNKNDTIFVSMKEQKNCLIEPFLLENLPLILKKVAQEKLSRANKNDLLSKNHKELKERRKYLRIKSDLPIKYTFISPLGNIPSEENISKIINISRDGIMFRVDFRAKFSDSVYLNILLPTCIIPIALEGEIRWDTFKSTEPWRYVGIKFFNLNPEKKRQIKNFIESSLG